jgi:hypothetical protein
VRHLLQAGIDFTKLHFDRKFFSKILNPEFLDKFTHKKYVKDTKFSEYYGLEF